MSNYPPSTGKYAKAYYSSGTALVPIWVEIPLIVDATVNKVTNSAEVPTRGDNVVQNVKALEVISADFNMRRQPSSAVYRKLRKVYQELGATVDLLFLSGPITSKNNEGVRGPMIIDQFTHAEPLQDGQGSAIIAKPAVPDTEEDEKEMKSVATFAKAITSGSAITADTDLYYDSTNKIATIVEGSNEYLGQCNYAVGDSDAVVLIDYLPPTP